MTKEFAIKILMLDHCTKSEAEEHLIKGSVVFDDLAERLDEYSLQWGLDTDEVDILKRMIKTNIPPADWGVVEFEDKTYYIQYVL